MSGIIKIYFGAKKFCMTDIPLEKADVVEVQCKDIDEAITLLLRDKWVSIDNESSIQYINTDNVLWFEVFEGEYDGEKMTS